MIKHHLLFAESQGEKILWAVFDGESNLSCIHPDQIKDLEIPVRLGRVRKLATANEGHFIEVKYAISVDFFINGVLLSDEFFLVPGLSEEAIIGAPTLRKWRIKLDLEQGVVLVDPKVAKQQLI